MARGRRPARAGGPLLAPGLAGGRRHAGPVPGGCRLAGGTGPARPGVRGLPVPLPRHGAVLPAAAGPLLGPVPHPPVLVPPPPGGPAAPGRPPRTPASPRLPYGDVLDRREIRAYRIARPGDRLPQRARLGHGDRFGVVRLGSAGLLPAVDHRRGLYSPAGLRQPETRDLCPLSRAPQSVYEIPGGTCPPGCRGRRRLPVLARRRGGLGPPSLLRRALVARGLPGVSAGGRRRFPGVQPGLGPL